MVILKRKEKTEILKRKEKTESLKLKGRTFFLRRASISMEVQYNDNMIIKTILEIKIKLLFTGKNDKVCKLNLADN